MASLVLYGFGTFAFACILWLYMKQWNRKYTQKFFPSPPSDPIIGHLRFFRHVAPWELYQSWAKSYGDVIQLDVPGRKVIILNNFDDAHSLLERKGSVYSDRARPVLLGEMGGMEHFLPFVRYGDEFRQGRRHISQFFNSREYINLYPILADQVKILAQNLIDSPENFAAHIDRVSAGTIVKTTFGYEITSNEDSYITLASKALIAANSLGPMGLNYFDLFPCLRYIPAWFPGANIIRRAGEAKKQMNKVIEDPYERVAAQRAVGVDNSSFLDHLLSVYEQTDIKDEVQENIIKNTAAIIYAAGAETSADTLLTFVLMMVQHPDVVKKAQRELDRVIGRGQLPTLEDRENLPYIECILKEVWRINPPLPLGLPHVSLREDIYKGKLIPAESLIVTNIWAMMRDERYFSNPSVFDPDRFLKEVENSKDNSNIHPLNKYSAADPSSMVFGFGRRICPGRFFADASAWLVVATVLSAFDILPPIDPVTGEEYTPELELVGGNTAQPKHFDARFVPRDKVPVMH